jgi:hypothetical protein
LLSALAISDKGRNTSTDDVLEVDLGASTVLVADDHRRTGHVFHASIFHPEFVGILRIDGNRRGNIPELRPDERQSGFVLSDRRLTLSFEGGIDDCELPAG